MAWNFTCWCILTTVSTAYILVMVCWFSSFWLSETIKVCSFPAFSWECIGGIGWTNLVISKEMEKAKFSILKVSSYWAGGITYYCVVRLFQLQMSLGGMHYGSSTHTQFSSPTIKFFQLWRSSRHSRLPHGREQQSIEQPALPAGRMYSLPTAVLEYIMSIAINSLPLY